MKLSDDFYKLVEEKDYLNHVLYSDTDSIYICVPTNLKDVSIENKIKLAKIVSKDINDLIQEYLTTDYFKRANIDVKNNYTDFKTEVIMSSIMFIPNVKKQYAYKTIVKDHRVLNEPKVDYKGIQVVRVDATKLGIKLLKEVIENIVLNSEIEKKDKIKHCLNVVNDIHNEFLECCENFKFESIGISGRWSKDNTVINSMLVYNFIFNDNVFLPGSSGKFVYCKFNDINKFKNLNVDLKKINAVSIPFSFNPEKIKEKFKEFGITLDIESQWDRIYTTTCQRIVDLVKQEGQNV